jgi:hypothetical protein
MPKDTFASTASLRGDVRRGDGSDLSRSFSPAPTGVVWRNFVAVEPNLAAPAEPSQSVIQNAARLGPILPPATMQPEPPMDSRQLWRTPADLPPPSAAPVAVAPAASLPVETLLNAAPTPDARPESAMTQNLPSAQVPVVESAVGTAEEQRDGWAPNARRLSRQGTGEKSAEHSVAGNLAREFAADGIRKDFQSVTPERHEKAATDVGTDVAKSSATMTSSVFVPRLEAATPAPLAIGLPGGEKVELGVAAWHETPPAAAVAGTAEKAVTAVLEWVERSTSRDQHSVSLKFAMGETPLRVSVEWRADEVRATFQTDSAELRAALAQEWQVAAAKSPERFDRFEAPVFTAVGSGATGTGSAASDGFARQSQSHPQHSGHESAGYRPARSELAGASVGTGAALNGPTEHVPATSRHLHTRA